MGRKGVERVLGAVEIEDATCAHQEGCPRRAEAAVAFPDQGMIALMCWEHARGVIASLHPEDRDRVGEIVRTCGVAAGPIGGPCGAVSSHLVMVDTGGEEPDLISMCRRHTQELGES